MFFELDVFWVKVGGVNPVAQINFLKGRISQLHLKDLRKGFQSPNFEKVSPDDLQKLERDKSQCIPFKSGKFVRGEALPC